MKKTDKQLEEQDYTLLLSQLKMFINTSKSDDLYSIDVSAVKKSDLHDLDAFLKNNWQVQASALEYSVRKLEAQEQSKLSQLRALTDDIKQGFLSLSLNPKRGAKGYLAGTSLEKTQDSALQGDWQKVGAHLVLSMRHYQNS
jgi:hypothetical protein